MESNRVSLKSSEQFSSFFDNFVSSIINLNLNESQTNEILKQSKELAHQCVNLNNTLQQNSVYTLNFIDNKINNVNSVNKRQKIMNDNPRYVKPKEYALGTRWEMVVYNGTGKRFRISVQSTFQYVSIIDTLKSTFGNSEFLQLYLEYNNNHQCGTLFSELGLSRNMIMLQLYTDDFEVCSVLKSKANLHKISAVYIQLTNLPPECLSKLSSIYLVALCNPDDLKQEYTNFNHILVKDIQLLERSGIEVAGNTILKGTIFTISIDNLGGNSCLGFTESFNSNYFCRICECHKELCQQLTKEIPAKLRTKESYDKLISEIAKNKVDLTLSKGGSRLCRIKS